MILATSSLILTTTNRLVRTAALRGYRCGSPLQRERPAHLRIADRPRIRVCGDGLHPPDQRPPRTGEAAQGARVADVSPGRAWIDTYGSHVTHGKERCMTQLVVLHGPGAGACASAFHHQR